MKRTLTQSEYSKRASQNHLGKLDLINLEDTPKFCEHNIYCIHNQHYCSPKECRIKKFYDKYGYEYGRKYE